MGRIIDWLLWNGFVDLAAFLDPTVTKRFGQPYSIMMAVQEHDRKCRSKTLRQGGFYCCEHPRRKIIAMLHPGGDLINARHGLKYIGPGCDSTICKDCGAEWSDMLNKWMGGTIDYLREDIEFQGGQNK